MDNRWIKGVALQDGALVGLPASAVLFGEDVRLGLTGWDAPLSTSNGTAVRERFEEARTHALLERMERDAVAIWWYNRLPAGALHATSVAAALPDTLGEFLAGRSRVTKHLLMPSDLPAPVVVAVSARADGTGLAIGAGAGLSAERALTSATLEMLECEVTLSHMRALQRRPNAPPVPLLLAWSDAAALAEPHLAGTAQAAMPPTITEAELVAALAAKGIRVYVADISRPEFPVAVARVVSPDLREWTPRFAPGRLFDVPVALGLLPAPLAEDALNPVPFPI